jgi:hypothetical protein
MAQNFTSTGTAVAPSGSDLLTELDAINTMLGVIGETPVASIDLSLPDVLMASKILAGAMRDVQTMGLNSNTDEHYTLTVSAVEGHVGEFSVPEATYPVLRIDPTNVWRNIVRRGSILYDKDNNTSIFTETELLVDIVWFLPFADLPMATRVYITMKAAKQFQARVMGSEVLGPYTKDDEFVAWSLFHSEELNTGDYTMLNSPGLYNLRRR